MPVRSGTPPEGTWIDPDAAMKRATGIGNADERKARAERLQASKEALAGTPRGPLLVQAKVDPALGMEGSRHSWPVQGVVDMFGMMNRMNAYIFSDENPYDSYEELIEDTTMSTFGLGTGAAAPGMIKGAVQGVPRNIAPIFGTRGITKEAYDSATAMKTAGKTDREIWQTTGLWNKDDTWIKETPTHNLKFKEGVIEPSKKDPDAPFQRKTRQQLGEMIDAPELFEQYPELFDLAISFRPTKGESRKGAAYLGADLINMSGKGEKDLRETLIHEIQHFIQYYDGLPNGTNPEAAFKGWSKANPGATWYPGNQEAYMRNSGEVQARLAEARSNLDPEQSRQYPPMFDEKALIAKKHGGLSYRLQEDRNPASQWKGDTVVDPSATGAELEATLSQRLNEIDGLLQNHTGTYKDRLKLMDERKDIQGNLMLAIKQRNTGKDLRGRNPASVDDTGMFDKDMPMDRVQAEIKMIRQFAKDSRIEDLTTGDIAMHVYGSDEKWALDRINNALRKADEERAASIAAADDNTGVLPPGWAAETFETKGGAQWGVSFVQQADDDAVAIHFDVDDNMMTDGPVEGMQYSTTEIFEGLREVGKRSRAYIAEKQPEEVIFPSLSKKHNNVYYGMLKKEGVPEGYHLAKKEDGPWNSRIILKKGKGPDDTIGVSPPPGPSLSPNVGQEVRRLPSNDNSVITEQSMGPAPDYDNVSLSSDPIEFENQVAPFVDNWLGTMYPTTRDMFRLNRFKRDGLSVSDMYHIIDVAELEGPKGVNNIIRMLENEVEEFRGKPEGKQSSAMLQFSKDLIKTLTELSKK